jgi:hypothetical protein
MSAQPDSLPRVPVPVLPGRVHSGKVRWISDYGLGSVLHTSCSPLKDHF